MDTHYHGIFQTPEANLSAAMQWFHGSYSAWYNVKHGRVGPLFQGRYRAIAVEDGAWAYPLSLYVHLNPLRIAGLGLDRHGRILESKGWREPTVEQVTERLARLRAYHWSSYRAYGGYERRPDWLETGTLLQQAHSDPARRAAAYRMEARRMLSYGVEPALVERLRDAVAIGSAAYAEYLLCCAATFRSRQSQLWQVVITRDVSGRPQPRHCRNRPASRIPLTDRCQIR